MSSSISLGQAYQFINACGAAGFSRHDITELGQHPELEEMLTGLRDVMKGRAVITKIKHVIDLDAEPFIPDDWRLEGHISDGKLEWDPEKIDLYFSNRQRQDRFINGHDLYKEIKRLPVLNANVLDFLLKHPELIPSNWSHTITIFFWGTVYRFDGHPVIRSLKKGHGGWYWDFRPFYREWHEWDRAALSKNN